jgi:hypothetical protein
MDAGVALVTAGAKIKAVRTRGNDLTLVIPPPETTSVVFGRAAGLPVPDRADVAQVIVLVAAVSSILKEVGVHDPPLWGVVFWLLWRLWPPSADS